MCKITSYVQYISMYRSVSSLHVKREDMQHVQQCYDCTSKVLMELKCMYRCSTSLRYTEHACIISTCRLIVSQNKDC